MYIYIRSTDCLIAGNIKILVMYLISSTVTLVAYSSHNYTEEIAIRKYSVNYSL